MAGPAALQTSPTRVARYAFSSIRRTAALSRLFVDSRRLCGICIRYRLDGMSMDASIEQFLCARPRLFGASGVADRWARSLPEMCLTTQSKERIPGIRPPRGVGVEGITRSVTPGTSLKQTERRHSACLRAGGSSRFRRSIILYRSALSGEYIPRSRVAPCNENHMTRIWGAARTQALSRT